MKSRFEGGLAGLKMSFVLALTGLATPAQADAISYQPVEWTKFVSVQGQPEPIPEQWLRAPEAKVAHSLMLPEAVSKPVPFDFAAAWWRSWLPGVPKVAVQYFNHLCKTEAGEWIFKKVDNVDGFYFARPEGPSSSGTLTDPHGLEMPWIQRVFVLTGESLLWQGAWFIQPPLYNYRYVEQPRREVNWQSHIRTPYVRLFGFTRGFFVKPGDVAPNWNEKTPMQVIGVSQLSARYGYTWRGVKRQRDREYGISGGEILIYDLQTKEVLAVRRQFLIAGKNPRGQGDAMWEVAASCRQFPSNGLGGEFTQFAFDVLQTVEPSTTKPFTTKGN